jgi:hypothetical protein
LPEQPVQVELDLDQNGVLVREEAADDPLQALDRGGEQVPNRLAELRVLPVLVEIGEQKPQSKRHVLDVVDEDAIESPPEARQGAGAVGHRPALAGGLPGPGFDEAHFDGDPGPQNGPSRFAANADHDLERPAARVHGRADELDLARGSGVRKAVRIARAWPWDTTAPRLTAMVSTTPDRREETTTSWSTIRWEA